MSEETHNELSRAMNAEEGQAYVGGYDCGLHGPNLINCHFSLFSTPEKTAAWERGKRAGEAKKAQKS